MRRFLIPGSIFHRAAASLRMHWNVPLHRSTYLFSANLLVGLISGVVFWVIAARVYSPADIGLASAFLAPATFLSIAFLFGANHGLLRFAHQIEVDPGLLFSLLWLAVLAGAMGSLIALVFLFLTRIIEPIGGSTAASCILYVILVSSSSVWTICEAAFVSLRAPMSVYLRSLLFALLRIILLIPLGAFGSLGLVAAFSISMGLAALPSLELLRRQIRPRRDQMFTLRHPLLRSLLGFALPNHAVTLIASIPGMVMPLMVLDILGADINGYFYLVWTAASVVRTVLVAASSSLLAEGSRDERLVGSRLLHSTGFLFAVVGSITLPIILFTHPFLSVLGAEYARADALALPLFALSVIPSVLTTVFAARERIFFRMRYLAFYSAANCLLSILLPYAGARAGGYDGFTLAYLVSQVLIGLVVIPFLFQGKPAGAAVPTVETREGVADA